MKINILLLIVYFVYYVNAYTDEVMVVCPNKDTEIAKCLAKVKNRKDPKTFTNFIFSDYMKCTDFNSNHQCIPNKEIKDISDGISASFRILCVDGFDKNIESCNMKSAKSRNFKDLTSVRNYAKRSINEINQILK